MTMMVQIIFLTMLSLVRDLIQKSFLESFHRSFHMTYCLMNLLSTFLIAHYEWKLNNDEWTLFTINKKSTKKIASIEWNMNAYGEKKSIMNDKWIFMDEIHPWTTIYIK
jgi:hypothetical protein